MKQQCITLKQSIQLVSVSKWFRHVSVSGPTKKPTTSRHDNAADNKSRAVLCNININLMEKLHEKCVFLTTKNFTCTGNGRMPSWLKNRVWTRLAPVFYPQGLRQVAAARPSDSHWIQCTCSNIDAQIVTALKSAMD